MSCGVQLRPQDSTKIAVTKTCMKSDNFLVTTFAIQFVDLIVVIVLSLMTSSLITSLLMTSNMMTSIMTPSVMTSSLMTTSSSTSSNYSQPSCSSSIIYRYSNFVHGAATFLSLVRDAGEVEVVGPDDVVVDPVVVPQLDLDPATQRREHLRDHHLLVPDWLV